MSLEILMPIMLLFLLTPPPVLSIPHQGLDVPAELISDIFGLGGSTEVNFIGDFSDPGQERMIKVLGKLGVAASIYEVEAMKRRKKEMAKEECPILDFTDPNRFPDSKLFMRNQVLFPRTKYQRTFFVWADDPVGVVELFDSTIMWCSQYKEPGVYHMDTMFYFISRNRTTTEVLFAQNNVQKHNSVASIERLGEDAFAFFGYNFYHSEQGDARREKLNFVWKKGQPPEKICQLFTSVGEFHGKKMTIGILPWAPLVVAAERTDGMDPNNQFKDYWGYEIKMLLEMSKRFDFKYNLTNPPSGLWGAIQDGEWIGNVAAAANGEIDLMIGVPVFPYIRSQVVQATIFFDQDHICFASPSPEQENKSLTLALPFEKIVWACIAISFIVGGVIHWIIAGLESPLMHVALNEWKTPKKAFWYCFGTLCGEAITRDTKSSRANSLRCIMGSWMLFCMVVAHSYAGNLKSYLTTPSYIQPISTLKEILESDLPWEMMIFGEEEEWRMSKSEDPIIKAIWDGKTIVDFNPVVDLSRVHKREAVTINWKTGIETAIFLNYSTADQQNELVHYETDPVYYINWIGWVFNKISPWYKRFNGMIEKMIESGLIDHWRDETWRRMKVEAKAAGNIFEFEPEPEQKPLTVDDLQGIFYLLFMCLGISAVAFSMEWCAWKAKRKGQKRVRRRNRRALEGQI